MSKEKEAMNSKGFWFFEEKFFEISFIQIVFFSLFLRKIRPLDQEHQRRENDDERKVERRKQSHVIATLFRIVFQIFAEGNQARERRNQRTCPTDVYPQEQFTVIARKLREQNCRRNVADTLTREHADQQGILIQEPRKEGAHPFDSTHIPCENEEKHKGQQKGIIDFFQCFSIEQEYAERNHNQADLVRNQAEHDDDGQREQKQINSRFNRGELDFLLSDRQRLGLDEKQAANCNQDDGYRKRQHHNGGKLRRGDIELGI